MQFYRKWSQEKAGVYQGSLVGGNGGAVTKFWVPAKPAPQDAGLCQLT